MAAIRGTDGNPGSPGNSIGDPNGGPGGGGGVGAYVIDDTGNIYGGTGGAGGNGFNSSQGYFGNGGSGGQGGTGVSLTGIMHVVSTVNIYGGTGGAGGQPGHGFFTAEGEAGFGGSGGTGLYMGVGVYLTNSGAISGGEGGAPGFGRGDILPGQGGNGVDLSGGYLVNFGNATGGNAYPVTPTTLNGQVYVHGGAGVYLSDGAILKNYGTISGGLASNGALGDAVQFGSSAATLKVEPGSVFNGQIAGNASIDDTLELDGTQAGGTGITLGTQFTGFQTLDFGTGAAWIVNAGAGAASSHDLTVEGFLQGDTFDVTNLNLATVAGDETGSSFTTTDGTFAFSGIPVGDHFVLTAANGGAGTDISLQAACYRRGTRILTQDGEKSIESLVIGDTVNTLNGAAIPIRWIGRRHYSCLQVTESPDLRPVRIVAGALGGGLPRRDLWVSPEHAMYIDGMLVAARDLVNGCTIVRELDVAQITYFHLEFEAHCVIYAEGAPAESYIDDDSRQLFDNAAEFHGIHPQTSSAPLRFCAPRVEEGEILEKIRRRIDGLVNPLSSIAA